MDKRPPDPADRVATLGLLGGALATVGIIVGLVRAFHTVHVICPDTSTATSCEEHPHAAEGVSIALGFAVLVILLAVGYYVVAAVSAARDEIRRMERELTRGAPGATANRPGSSRQQVEPGELKWERR